MSVPKGNELPKPLRGPEGNQVPGTGAGRTSQTNPEKPFHVASPLGAAA